MRIEKFRNIALLVDNGDTVCFNVQAPDPVFIPAEKRSILDVYMRGEDHLSSEAGNEEFLLYMQAHGMGRGPDHVPVLPEKKGCEMCGGHGAKREFSSVYLLLTHGCNQSCIYCLNGRETYGTVSAAMMTDHVAFKALRQVAASLTENGRLEIVFFGGEPLLNWPLAKRIMRWADTELQHEFPSLQFHYHLTTNLTIFPEDLLDYTKEFGITYLVDVDGPPDIHNLTRPYRSGLPALADTLRHIERLRSADIDVALRATVTSYNHSRMLEVSRFHREAGGTSSAFVPLNAVDSDGRIMPRELCPDPEIYKSGLKEVYHADIWPLKELFPFNEYANRFSPGIRMNHGCGAPFGNTPAVTADGKIFTCIYLVNNPPFEAGCVEKGDYPREEVLRRMREVTDTNRQACRNCVFQYLCGGGCPVGLFSILLHPGTADWAKRYTRDIACATLQGVFSELLFDAGRSATRDLERQKELPDIFPVDQLQAEVMEAEPICIEQLWQIIQQECENEKNGE